MISNFSDFSSNASNPPEDRDHLVIEAVHSASATPSSSVLNYAIDYPNNDTWVDFGSPSSSADNFSVIKHQAVEQGDNDGFQTIKRLLKVSGSASDEFFLQISQPNFGSSDGNDAYVVQSVNVSGLFKSTSGSYIDWIAGNGGSDANELHNAYIYLYNLIYI